MGSAPKAQAYVWFAPSRDYFSSSRNPVGGTVDVDKRALVTIKLRVKGELIRFCTKAKNPTFKESSESKEKHREEKTLQAVGREKGAMRKRDFPFSRGYSKQRDHLGQSENVVVDTEETLDPSIEYFYMYEIFILAMRLAESRFIPLYILTSHPPTSSKGEKILDPLTVKEGYATWFRKEILGDLRFAPQKRTIIEDIFSRLSDLTRHRIRIYCWYVLLHTYRYEFRLGYLPFYSQIAE
ncbi:hypothetical protein G5I_14615 [Acromyrmex echinatior]|uniref:Uncharacterized protein n=1 Tax=Acromyrmex echinatior TaxID=103372 RepID=F4X8D6_ACREC|nr:hypothetical protein G5I_14615 [Acromyrmex echinatior]